MAEFELVLPCYNESKSIRTLVERAAQAAKEAGFGPDRFQLVLVENGSKDDSSRVMQELKSTPLGEWFRIVPVTINEGYGFGLWSGLKATSARYVGWSHADQQCDPKDAFKALALLTSESNSKSLVKGTRSGRNWKDRVVSLVFETVALLILGLRCRELNAQPKVFPRELLGEVVSPPKTFAFDLYVLYRAKKNGYRFKTVPVLFPPRIHGVSNWASNFMGRYKTILGMIRYMWDLARSEGRV